MARALQVESKLNLRHFQVDSDRYRSLVEGLYLIEAP